MHPDLLKLSPRERAGHYRELAAEASGYCALATEPRAKESFREIAAHWLALAALAEAEANRDQDRKG